MRRIALGIVILVILLGACTRSTPEPAPISVPPLTPLPQPTPTPKPTPRPTPTSPPQIPNRVRTFKVSDAIGDLFDKNGKAATDAPYLDIIETEVILWSDNRYTAKITVNGAIPAKIDEPSNFIEWDVLIDSDNSPSTGWNSSLLFNDIGVDYVIRFWLNASRTGCSILDVKTNESVSFPCAVHNNNREFNFRPKQLGEPDRFNFTTAVRNYGVEGDPTSLITGDKAPNQNHYSFPDSS